MTFEIEAYSFGWHQQNGCIVQIKGKGMEKWQLLKVSAEQLAALAAILKESPVFYKDGWIHTGQEPILE